MVFIKCPDRSGLQWFPTFSHICDREAINTIGDAFVKSVRKAQKTLCPSPATVKFPAVFKPSNAGQSALIREAIIKAFQDMSDELGQRGVTGELCLFAEGKI